MADRQLRILGPVELWSADGRVELAGRRQRAVLARLASARGAVVSTERLITDIWNGHPPDHALGVLQAHVSTLRRLLEPDRAPRTPPARLVTRQPGYALSLPTDGDRFDELVTQAIAQLGAGHAGAAAATLDGALALWSGDAYADLSDEPWLAPEIQRLSELRLTAREQRMEAALQLGQLQTAIPELRQLAEENPLREELWRLLALALYRSGRQADALAALRQARSLLAEELGLDPGRALQDLEAAVLAQDDRVLLGIGAPPEPTPMPALGSVPGQRTGGRPMIGRRDALDWIDQAAAEVVSGRQRMVVVTGEAGIGKTRLAETATETLRGQGWLVVWGRCYESSGAPPLWPWAQVLRELDAVVPLPPALTDLQAGNPGGDATEIAEARFRQQQAVAGYLAEVAGRACLAVVLEDVQWADAASLSLLAALPDLARSARILALVTARGDEAAPAQASALDRLSRHEPVRLALDGLTAADVADLIALYRRITGGQGLDAEALRRRTGGNPFLLRETLRELAGTGGLAALSQVPAGAAGLLRQRLERVSADTRAVLRRAAVLGSRIDLPVLAALCARAPDEVAENLDEAAAAGILVLRPHGLEFAHDLVRETIYDDLGVTTRARLHGAAVAVLERRVAIDPALVASHALAAGAAFAPSALDWMIAAAEQAAGGLAYDDAVRWWTAALDVQAQRPQRDRAQRVELLLRLVEAQLRSTDSAAAEQTRRAAVLLTTETDDGLLQGRALTALDVPSLWAFRHYGEVDHEVVGLIRTNLSRADLPEALRCRLLATLANELVYGDDELRAVSSAEALALARRLGDARLHAFALLARFQALDGAEWGAVDELAGLGEELLELDRAGLPGVALYARFIMGLARLRAFDLAGADEQAAAARRYLPRHGPSMASKQLGFWACSRLTLAGRFEEAAALLADLEREPGIWAGGPFLATVRAVQLVHADRIRDAGPLLTQVRAFHPTMGLDLEVLFRQATGDRAGAEAMMRDHSPPDVGRDWLAGAALALRGLAAAAAGNRAQRTEARARLLPSKGRLAVTGSVDGGPVDLVLGRLAAALGDTDAAAEHFLALRELASAGGLDYWRRRATVELATLHP